MSSSNGRRLRHPLTRSGLLLAAGAGLLRRIRCSLPRGKTALALAAVTGICAASASASAPRKWYWTQAHAEATVLAKVRIPACRVQPSDPSCARVMPHRFGYAPESTSCTGSDELRQTFTYSRFSCAISIGYISRQTGAHVLLASGELAVYVTGPTTFRWKIIG